MNFIFDKLSYLAVFHFLMFNFKPLTRKNNYFQFAHSIKHSNIQLLVHGAAEIRNTFLAQMTSTQALRIQTAAHESKTIKQQQQQRTGGVSPAREVADLLVWGGLEQYSTAGIYCCGNEVVVPSWLNGELPEVTLMGKKQNGSTEAEPKFLKCSILIKVRRFHVFGLIGG